MNATLTATETTETETAARTNVRRISWPTGYAELSLTAPHGREEARRWQALVRVDFAKIHGRRAGKLPTPIRKHPARGAADHGAAVARFADVIAKTCSAEGNHYETQIGRALLPGWVMTATDEYAAILAPGDGRPLAHPYAEGAPLAPVTADGWQAYAKVRSLGARRPVAWRWTPDRLTFTATDADGDEVSAWAPLAAGAGADGAITLGDGYLAPLMGPTWAACLTSGGRPGTIPGLVLTAPAGDVRVVIAGCR